MRVLSLTTACCVLLLSAEVAAAGPTQVFEFNGLVEDDGAAPGWAPFLFAAGGTQVYVAGDPGIGVRSRDPVTGLLGFVQNLGTERDDPQAISADGAFLYATDRYEDQVEIYARDPGTGALTFVASEAIDDPWDAILGPGDAQLYVINSYQVQVFDRDAGTGLLTHVETQTKGGIRGGALPSDAAHLYTVDYDCCLDVFTRNAVDGTLTHEPGLSFSTSTARDFVMSPDDAHLYLLTRESSGTLHVYARNPTTGALTLVESEPAPIPFSSSSMGISPDGAFVYVQHDDDEDVISIFSRNASTGELTFVADETVGVDRGPVEISPDGAHLYTANYTKSIVVHTRDLGTGLLTLSGAMPSVEGASSGAISPDGAHVYLAFGDDWIGALSRNASTGELTPVQWQVDDLAGTDGLENASGVAISPTGTHVYAVGRGDGAIATFSRNPVTGELTFLDSLHDGVGGVVLEEPVFAWVSPDGESVYVTGEYPARIMTLFDRDPATGLLTYVGETADDYMRHAFDVCPNGLHAYGGGGSLRAYDRNPTTGELTFAQSYDGSGGGIGYQGMEITTAVVCSDDGEHVYALGGPFHGPVSVLVFDRDPASGALSVIQFEESTTSGFFEMSRNGIGMSGDGEYVFASYPLHVFRRDAATGRLAFVSADPWKWYQSTSSPTHILAPIDGNQVYETGVGNVGTTIHSPGFGCSDTPLAGCRTGDVANLTVTDSLIDIRDKIAFTLSKGDATDFADFDPGTDNHFALCLYDESGAQTLVSSSIAPAGEDCRGSANAAPKPCWKTTTVAKLKDRYATPDGLRKMTLKPGVDGKTKIIVRANGWNVQPPALPVGMPLRAQVQAASGLCWDAVFSSATKNDAERFKAKFKN